MEVVARALWLPKAGNAVDEYEDAWTVAEETPGVSEHFRCSVADGATEASFSGLWARLLTEGYCAGTFPQAPAPDDFAALQAGWAREVATIPLPWYAEEKARSGAFSTLLGLTITATGRDPTREVEHEHVAGGAVNAIGGRWEALAIGDSCLFQVRQERLVTAWPLADADSFTNRPTLLSSNPARNATVAAHLTTVAGDWLPGDVFYLLTDALACWFLLVHEAGGAPWCDLDAVATAEGGGLFIDWIAALRADRRLRNDDVTLLRVAVGGIPPREDGRP